MATSRHEKCQPALVEELEKESDVLDNFFCGCKKGDHTTYAIVEAKSRSNALAMISDFLQDAACVSKVAKFTPAEIKPYHAKAA